MAAGPGTVSCAGCSATLRVSHAGDYRCPRCLAPFLLEANGSTAALHDQGASPIHLTITGSHPTRLRDLFVMFEEILSRPLEVEYQGPHSRADNRHYRVTPYAYMPRAGRKLTASHQVDMGQGILELIHEIDHGRTEE